MSDETHAGLKMDVSRVGDSALVRVIGSVNMANADYVRRTLERLAMDKAKRIVLDLTEMDFICSAGLAAIIYAHLKCRHHHGQVRLVNPQPEVRHLLEATRLTKLFPIYDEVTAAVRADP